MVQGEVYTKGKIGEQGMQAYDGQKMAKAHPDAEYVIFNGKVGALTGDGALKARVGERVRIYFGVGGFLPSSFHVIGEIFDHVYHEGAMSAPAQNVQTTFVPAGGATIVEFMVDVPGTYILVDHTLSRLDRGAAGLLVVEGAEHPEIFQGKPTGGNSGH